MVSRRDFVAAAAAAAGLAGLSACNDAVEQDAGSQTADAPVYVELPSADDYPLEPDAPGVEPLYTSEQTADGWTRYLQKGGATLGVADPARVIQVDGWAFRDANGNGRLDLYEDWRRPAAERAQSLADRFAADEILPLTFAPDVTADADPVAEGARAGILRPSTDVTWINATQQAAEGAGAWGVPYLACSEPVAFGDMPGTAGLASAMDADLWRRAGMWASRALRSAGVRMELGRSADLRSDPRGARLADSPGGDPALSRDFIRSFGSGMQSTWGDDDTYDDRGWGDESCGVTPGHVAGAGAGEGGRDDRSDAGKWSVFPGSCYDAHLVPFLDGAFDLDGSTGAALGAMPCLGIAYDPNNPSELGEHVGGAYSAHVTDALRSGGWDGWACTDRQALSVAPHGVRNLTLAERWAKLQLNGVLTVAGEWEPDAAREGLRLLQDELGESEALELLRNNARTLLAAMMRLGLFEQPYAEAAAAREVLEGEGLAAFGREAARRSVVMLKNAGGLIGEAGVGSWAYVSVEDLAEGNAAERLADVSCAVVRVANPADAYQGMEPGVAWKPISLQYADYAADGDAVRRESLNPADEYGAYENRSYVGEATHCANADVPAFVRAVREALPEDGKLVLVVDADRPMVFSEVEPLADAILLGFGGVGEAALEDVLNGAFEPCGLLVYQMPASMETVEASQEDVPRDLEPYVDAEGNAYDFCFGLNWSGPIDDDRVATYGQPPLTEPEAAR